MNNRFLESFNLWLNSKKSRPPHTLLAYPFLKLVRKDEDWSLLNQCLDQVLHLKLSLSDGLKAIELFTEIILIENDSELKKQVLKNNADSSSWLKKLNELRYPLTSQRDEIFKSKLVDLPWPYGSKVKFERRGDRAGVELKSFISSSADITKIIASLERVKNQLLESEQNGNPF